MLLNVMRTSIHFNLYLNILDTDLETLYLENSNFLNNNATLVIHLVTHSLLVSSDWMKQYSLLIGSSNHQERQKIAKLLVSD